MYKEPFGFQSSLAEVLTSFVKEKRACGFTYNMEVWHLRQLDQLWSAPGAQVTAVSREWFQEFVRVRPGKSPGCPARRASLWRELVRHARRRGLEGYLPDAGVLPIRCRSYAPFIFTRKQLGSLFAAADQATVHSCSPRRPWFMGLMLRLLYGTGLRVGEALALNMGDYDPIQNVLIVHQGKNQTERFLPLTASLGERLREYGKRFPGNVDTPLFLSPKCPRAAVYGGCIRRNFRKLLITAGLPARIRRVGPRVHDLRHTFAVHRLENWYLAGEDITAKLPILSAYLGHRELRDTYYYLRITASFFPEITRRLEAYAGDVIPKEVGHETH